MNNVEVLYHSSIRIDKSKIIYIDPYKIDRNYNDADIVFITHSHYDHFSEEDIDKVRKENTIFVGPEDVTTKLTRNGIISENIISVEPGDMEIIQDIQFVAVPAYNINKPFHPKENNWLGYVITVDGVRCYIAGDTDITNENRKVKCDVAFVPVGGTYTMNYKEAAELVNEIKPQIAVPIHYGSIVGTEEDAYNFINLLDAEIQGVTLMK